MPFNGTHWMVGTNFYLIIRLAYSEVLCSPTSGAGIPRLIPRCRYSQVKRILSVLPQGGPRATGKVGSPHPLARWGRRASQRACCSALLDLPAPSEAQGVSPQRAVTLGCPVGLLRGSQSVGWGAGTGRVMGHCRDALTLSGSPLALPSPPPVHGLPPPFPSSLLLRSPSSQALCPQNPCSSPLPFPPALPGLPWATGAGVSAGSKPERDRFASSEDRHVDFRFW